LEEYKERIYEQYPSLMSGKGMSGKLEEERVKDRGYDKTLRGWLPEGSGASILDVGCGGGMLLNYLKKRGFHNIQGVDISGERVRAAREVCQNVEKADAVDFLAYHKESFDLIVGLDVIEHLEKKQIIMFLESCYKALRLGGRLILQTPNAESPWGMSIAQGDFTHEVSFTPVSLCSLLELCGFGGIEAREVNPCVHGILSMLRLIVWKMIWLFLAVWNLAETGRLGYGIYSRVFLISGIKRAQE
jgi:SAM-dependent methyltransferase